MICAYCNSKTGGWREGLLAAFREFHPQVLPFSTTQELVTLAQRTLLDMVVIPAEGTAGREIALGAKAKAVPSLMVVPVIVWHKDPDPEIAQQILSSNIDDMVTGEATDITAHARLRLALRRSWRDLDVNPSSRLPGPTTIERVLQERIHSKECFAVCYADLDDFKAYNDYYGYFYGDKVIKMTSRVVRDSVFEHQPNGFVGHIGGDDFVFVIDPSKAKKVCQTIIARFEAEIGLCYVQRDRRNGYIISKNRRGVPESFPLMNISIAVVVDRGGMFTHVGEISHMVADLKKYVKTIPGSNYVFERRGKY
ncbi:MAG: GGDEF domain-containing protein [candidate division Zixibacteria bacterium]|nr:GGDEF domain-containing protein [candidate division Zixibacteria bacterium]